MATTKISGRIIRILNTRTVIVNLGSLDGITTSSVFSIMGDPEPVVDPETNEELGNVTIVKSRVKAVEVAERFTIATSKWTESGIKFIDVISSLSRVTGYETETKEIDEGELNVRSQDIQPWLAKSSRPVKVGDRVEVSIFVKDKEQMEEKIEEVDEETIESDE